MKELNADIEAITQLVRARYQAYETDQDERALKEALDLNEYLTELLDRREKIERER